MGKLSRVMGYWWDRWQRGMTVLIMIALCLVVTALAALIPLTLLAALTGEPAWKSIYNIGLVAVLILMPFYLTDEGLRYALRDLYSDQEKAERERRSRD